MKVLVVIDMQNDFIDGSLGTPEAKAIVPNVVNKIKEYKDMTDSFILFTLDTHYSNYLSTQEGHRLPVEHCIIGTKGHELNTEIISAVGNSSIISINKPSFGSEELVSILKNQYISTGLDDLEIELVGLCSDICVVSNALMLKAALPEVTITVDSTCVAGVTKESNQAALLTMKMCQINVIGE